MERKTFNKKNNKETQMRRKKDRKRKTHMNNKHVKGGREREEMRKEE